MLYEWRKIAISAGLILAVFSVSLNASSFKQEIDLSGTAVSASGILKLADCGNLQRLVLTDIPLTNDDLDKLNAAFPDCIIDSSSKE